MKNHFETGG